MLSKSFTLLFYLEKRSNHVKGKLPIYMRLTIDGKWIELAVKRSSFMDFWYVAVLLIPGRTITLHLEMLNDSGWAQWSHIWMSAWYVAKCHTLTLGSVEILLKYCIRLFWLMVLLSGFSGQKFFDFVCPVIIRPANFQWVQFPWNSQVL